LSTEVHVRAGYTQNVGSALTSYNELRLHPQTNQLMLSGEIDGADCDNCTVGLYVNTISDRNAEFSNVTADGSTCVFTSVHRTVTDSVPTCWKHQNFHYKTKPVTVVLCDDRSLWQ
jgi:hypothetical protein